MPKIGLKNALSKGLGTAGKIFSLLDTVAMVDKVSKNTAPILEKAIDRHYDQQKELIDLPDVRHLPVETAQTHLEQLGFVVMPLLAKPYQISKHSLAGEVLSQTPHSGKFKAGHLIKLYHATEELLRQKQYGINLSQLKGIPISEVQNLLNTEGIKSIALPIAPDKRYADIALNTVVATDPKATAVTAGSLVKLYYLDQETLDKSRSLSEEHQAKKQAQQDLLTNSLNQVRDLSEQSLDKMKELFKK